MGVAGLIFEPRPLNFENQHNFWRCLNDIKTFFLISLLVSDFQKISVSVQSMSLVNWCKNESFWKRFTCTGKKVLVGSTNAGIPKVWLYIAIVLSCCLIGSWATERANQRATQNSFYLELDFGVPGFVLLNLKPISNINWKFLDFL